MSSSSSSARRKSAKTVVDADEGASKTTTTTTTTTKKEAVLRRIAPSRKDDTTAIASVVVPTPLGMVIEESANYRGKIEVIDVVPDGNAAKAGIRVGDILRGTTGMALNIQQASEEDFGFSVGLSEGTKQLAFLPTDRKNFDSVMNALQSNANRGEATLLFERVVKAAPQ